MRRGGPAASLSITISCKSIKSLVSEVSVKNVELNSLRFNRQSHKEATSFSAITEVSEKLNSDSSVADNTFLKRGVMLKA